MMMLSTVLLSACFSVVASALDYSICDAYLALENKTQCGPSGYAMHFGYPICRKFIDNEWQFTPDGQTFLRCVRPCLADFINANITAKDVTDCTAITNMAYASHVPCYDECHFCDVVIANVLPFARTFQVTDFLSEIAVNQVLQVALKCASNPVPFFTGPLAGVAL